MPTPSPWRLSAEGRDVRSRARLRYAGSPTGASDPVPVKLS